MIQLYSMNIRLFKGSHCFFFFELTFLRWREDKLEFMHFLMSVKSCLFESIRLFSSASVPFLRKSEHLSLFVFFGGRLWALFPLELRSDPFKGFTSFLSPYM